MSAPAASRRKKPQGPDGRWKFFALFVLVGLLGLIPFALQAVRDYRIARVYQQAECEIIDQQMVETTTVYRWGGGDRTEDRRSHPEFTFKFRADGKVYVTTGLDNHDGVTTPFEQWRYFTVGSKYPCWYDPADPEKAVLLRRFESKFYLGALIPGFFIVVCGNLMRRALAGGRDYGKGATYRGLRLRYRLTPDFSHQKLTGCLLIVVVVLAMALVGIWAVPWHARTTEIFSPMFILFGIVLAIEVFMIYHFIRAVKLVGVGEPEVEIDDEPLAPGQSTSLNILQGGPLRAQHYEVLLVCQEVSIETRTPVKTQLIERGKFEIPDAAEENAKTFTASFTIPDTANPSSRELQFIRTWSIRVRRKIDDETTLETDFPFRVMRKSKAEDPAAGTCEA